MNEKEVSKMLNEQFFDDNCDEILRWLFSSSVKDFKEWRKENEK